MKQEAQALQLVKFGFHYGSSIYHLCCLGQGPETI